MIIVGNAIILDNTESNLEDGIPMNNSRIAWDNALTRATLTSTDDPSNVDNVFDYMTTTFWEAGTLSATLDITLDATEAINCAGVAAGNWTQAGATIQVYAGGNLVGQVSGLKDGQPYLFEFDEVTTNNLSFVFNSNSGSLSIGQLMAGKILEIPRCASIGLQLGQFNNKDKVIGQLTENNAFAANSTVARGRETVAPYSLLPIDWVRSDWKEFSDNHKGKPIWYAWDNFSYPYETIFGHWSASDIPFSRSTYADLTLTVKGQV